MAKVPFTSGKNLREDGSSKPGGKFKQGTGGATSRGITPKEGNTAASTSNANTRVGGLKKRMHGASGTKGYPR
jgi:hypothetical protein